MTRASLPLVAALLLVACDDGGASDTLPAVPSPEEYAALGCPETRLETLDECVVDEDCDQRWQRCSSLAASRGYCISISSMDGCACANPEQYCLNTGVHCSGGSEGEGTCVPCGGANEPCCNDGQDACGEGAACYEVDGVRTCLAPNDPRLVCEDGDGDGFFAGPTCNPEAAQADCDDSDRGAFPGSGEVCNGRDDDCDGDIDTRCVPCGGLDEWCCELGPFPNPGVCDTIDLRCDFSGTEPRCRPAP